MWSLIFHSTYKKPVILAGSGVRSANAVDMLQDFVKKTNIPLLTTMNAVDIAQGDIHIGFIGTHGNRVANMILNEADIVISIGARLGIRQVGRTTKKFAPNADLVRCDIDEYELSRNIKKDEKKYHTDARDFMRILMTEHVGDFTNWRKKCIAAKRILEDYDKQPGNLAVEKIAKLLPENPIVSVDVGMNQCWCAQSLELKGNKGRILISGGYGTMGCALPYAIGSSVASGKKRIYCISGDGGLQMNIQELETVKRENLPIKIIVLNNHVLGKISETQHLELDNRYANTTFSSGYTVPDFCRISEAYGIRSIKLNSYKELDKIEDWLYDNIPCLIDIKLPENSLLTPKIQFETQKVRPELDDKVVFRVKELFQAEK